MNPIEPPQGEKRKRSISDEGPPPPPPPPSSNALTLTAQSNVTQVNYFLKTPDVKLQLIEDGSETSEDVLAAIQAYEAILRRGESFAVHLGAKLVGPLLLKSVESMFQGPIKILMSQDGSNAHSFTWLDIIEHASIEPNSFVLSESPASGKICQFWLQNNFLQISEDDYRLILTGAPSRVIPTQPIVEDEIAELGTLEILEERLSGIIKKADQVALRARQLRNNLKGRKTNIQGRRMGPSAESAFSGGHGPEKRQSSAPFQAVNTRSSGNGEASAVRDDLLRLFQPDEALATTPSGHNKAVHPSVQKPSLPQSNSSPRPSPSQPGLPRQRSKTWVGGEHRPAMMAKMEKLGRNIQIRPPCDRCRRLGIACIKYLTACDGCTRKHARCSWRDITAEEVAQLQAEGAMGIGGDHAVGGGGAAAKRGVDFASDASGAFVALSSTTGAAMLAAHLNTNLDPGLRATYGGDGVVVNGQRRNGLGSAGVVAGGGAVAGALPPVPTAAAGGGGHHRGSSSRQDATNATATAAPSAAATTKRGAGRNNPQ